MPLILADGVGSGAFALSEAVLSGFIRVMTTARIFKDPTPTDTALDFCRALRKAPQACLLRPGERNWTIFESLCRTLPARGKLVADAWHAALAIEYDCEWISTDSDFSRCRLQLVAETHRRAVHSKKGGLTPDLLFYLGRRSNR